MHSGGGRQRGTLSEINVTPFVDVMLVLLVIFMVTAPLMQQGMDVNLPEARGKQLPEEERISILVRKNGSISLNDSPVTMEQMAARLEMQSKFNPNVFLRADRDVPYGIVARVMGEIRGAGIERLGIVTEPAKEKR